MTMTPQNPATTVVPTAVYVPTLSISLNINANGQLVAKVQLQFQGATVDTDGKWSKVGAKVAAKPFSFSFDSQGNVTGLPANLAPAASSLATAFAAIEGAANEINTLAKLV